MKQFTSTARKDGRWWVVQCDQHPGALSQVSRLDQAEEHQREAIAFVVGLDEAEIAVQVRPELDAGLADKAELARDARQQSEEMSRTAAGAVRDVAKALADAGYSLRDVGTILGVSHQRVGQLLSERTRRDKAHA